MPVISVGNIAMGGRGKTPVVAHLAKLLLEAGERPAILSRGYGRARPRDGAVIVSDGTHILADLPQSGDEPLMLARDVPGAAVVVCDVRAVAAALASTALGVTVHLLDDGFQHRAMKRDADIVVVAPSDLRDRRVPFGRLRSSVASLAAADAVVIDGDFDDTAAAVRRYLAPGTPLFALCREIGTPVPLEPARPWPDPVGSVVALAGIAAPERFARMLRESGWRVTALVPFRDHHHYRARDLAKVTRVVADTGATAVLTTSKDAVRLLPWRPLPWPVAAVPLAVTIAPAGLFRRWLGERIARGRA